METMTERTAAIPITPDAGARGVDPTAPYLADFEAFERELSAAELVGQPAGLRALRRQAIESFARQGFPTTRQEEWRSTNLAALTRASFQRPAQPAELDRSALEPWLFEASACLVFVDGRFAPGLSETAGLPAGVIATGLAEALELHPEKVEAHLARHAKFESHPFVALNTAFLRDGAFVWLPRGAAVEKPVHLLFLASGREGGATVNYPRNLIVAEEASQVAIVETYAGSGPYFTCAVTEMVAGPAAVIDHYKVQRESLEAFHLATFQIHADRACTPSSHSISIGGALVRNDVNALLAGEGVDCTLNGLYLAEGRQFVDNHMRVEHAAPHCDSHELYKGILDGKARAVFNGLIHVRHGAQKTDAKQSNRNLLLSRDAIANSNPQLEIFADDVKCTHGSTVGQLDDDAVFYLRSRGIGEAAARSILTYAFASDIVERIKVEPVRRDLEEFLFARLPQGEVVRQAV
jgi:Fe-S cluster assembly protein SufD